MPVFPSEGRPANWCRWCGLDIVHGRAASRSWHDGREDEPNCKLAWQLHTDRRVQFPHVVGRDGLKCWDCGEAPEKWIKGAYPRYHPPISDYRKDTYVGEWWSVERATALEMEHSTPLWAVAHRPDEERRFYFGPHNLRLRCPTCHSKKTKREARDRAHVKRLEAPKASKGRKIPGRSFGPSAKFPAGRKLQSRNDLRRR